MELKSERLHKPPAAPGLHLIGDLHECECPMEYLTHGTALRERCLALVQDVELSIAGDYFHQFDGGGGVTGVVVLSESHLALHTWPEKLCVTLDIYVCNYEQNNRAKARRLFDELLGTFAPRAPRTYSIDRV